MHAGCLDSEVGERFLTLSLFSDFILSYRPETAASVTYLVDRVTAKLDRKSISTRRRILDICTGTGCIPLLFHDEFYKRREVQHVPLDIRGYDISPAALRLAEENRAMQLARPENISSRLSDPSERVKCLQNTKFFHYDLSSGISHGATDGSGSEPGQDFCSSSAAKSSCIPSTCDILISNPPYIPLQEYYRTTARSVRNFEPRLALVPPGANHRHHHGSARNIDQGDLFYPHLLALAERLSAKFVLLEVADAEQARRVVAMALQLSWNVDVEIWHDEPSVDRRDEIKVDGHNIRIVGEGNGRSVFIRRKEFEGLGSDVFPDTERVRT